MALSDSDWASCIESLRDACEAGASAAYPWVGMLNKEEADAAASRAMRDALRKLRVATRVIAGEGEKDGVEHLAVGEIVPGMESLIGLDLAVDPIEGTTNLAHGLPWALSVAAGTPYGGMMETGPSLYMDKLVVPPAAAPHIDPEASTASRLNSLASALDKSVSDLRVFVLDKPRHKELVREIVAAGAHVAFYPAGDVVGTCAVALGEHFDAVMGIGGTPEGMLSACAVRALGGGFFARLTPQRPDEEQAMSRDGVVANQWMSVGDLIRSDRSFFCAAGITDSLLASGVSHKNGRPIVSSLTVEGPSGTVTRVSRHIS